MAETFSSKLIESLSKAEQNNTLI